MFLPTAGSAAAAQAAAVASVTQQQLQLQTAAQHINNINNVGVGGTGQTQVRGDNLCYRLLELFLSMFIMRLRKVFVLAQPIPI